MKNNDQKIFDLIENNFNERSVDEYIIGLSQIFDKIHQKHSERYNKEILKKQNDVYSEKELYKYYQLISELIIGDFLYENHADSLEYDLNVNHDNKSDIDFQVVYDQVTYNIEVKCPHLKNRDNFNALTGKLKCNFVSRTSSREALGKIKNDFDKDIFDNILKEKTCSGVEYSKQENEKLRTFLTDKESSCQVKFTASECNDEVNVLICNLDSNGQFLEWAVNITSELNGFFSRPYIEREEFDRTDVIVLTNLIAGHRDDILLDNHKVWEFENIFAYAFYNPFSIRNRRKFIKAFKETCLNLDEGMLKVMNNDRSNGEVQKILISMMWEMRVPVNNGWNLDEPISLLMNRIYEDSRSYSAIVEAYIATVKKYNLKVYYSPLEKLEEVLNLDNMRFDAFRGEAIKLYMEDNAPVDFINSIHDLLFINYIYHYHSFKSE